MSNKENQINDIHFKQITADTVLEICKMSQTLTKQQQKAVADNAVSIAQAYFSKNVWMRAIYKGSEAIGFIMLHIGSDWSDGIDCPGVFLWRFMIAKPFQGLGYGKKAIECLLEHLRALGIPELYTSYHLGDASPEGFYKSLGFIPTGEYYGEEPEVVLRVGL